MEVIVYYKKSRVRTEDHIRLKVIIAKKYKLRDAYTKNAEALGCDPYLGGFPFQL